MAKLTKRQQREIRDAINSLERLMDFINDSRIEVCRRGRINEDVPPGPQDFRQCSVEESKDYTGADGAEWTINFVATLDPMEKGIGSDLVAMHTTHKILRNFLCDNT